ncbi:MAG: ComF family protein [Oscillospiraceae bacterium]|nr:ComF family protein [Oscillospiraceae bacterium]
MWYYKDNVRKSIHRFKFGNARSYAGVYARFLALRLQNTFFEPFDILTWVPVSGLRKLKRGYDQTELIAKALSRELGMPATRVLKKIRHTPPQSGLRDAAQRRANVLGAYKSLPDQMLGNKRILLLDDVLTTGATASECARVLLTAGAKEVYFAAVAVASDDKK